MRKKHNSEIEQFETDQNMLINFDSFTDEWNRQVRVINKDNQREVYRVRSNEYDLVMNPKSFEEVARRHNRRVFNSDNYHSNSDLFLDNIKNQIFAETQRLLNGGKADESEYSDLDDKFKTGYEYEDTIINIAANDDPKLLKVIEGDNDLNRTLNNPNKITDHEAIDRAKRSKVRAIKEEALSDEDRKKINSYSNLGESRAHERVTVHDGGEDAWTIIKDDIVDFNKAKEQGFKKVREDSINNSPWEVEDINSKPISPAEQQIKDFASTPPPIPTKSVLDNDNFLSSSNNVVRPSEKPVSSIVTNEQRIQNLKEIEDTNWERIKSYVRDFNTSDKTVAIGNAASIVDADNALKVDLNAKFYLTPEELKRTRDMQAETFQNVINEYEETLKKHEEKTLAELYGSISSIPEAKLNTKAIEEISNKKQRQDQANMKAIDENIKLKKQIMELESELNKKMEAPKVEPRLAKFEMEEEIVEIKPTNNANEQKQQPVQQANVAPQQPVNEPKSEQSETQPTKGVVKLRLVNGKVVKEYINQQPVQQQQVFSEKQQNGLNINNNQNPSSQREFSTLPKEKGIDFSKLLTRQKDAAQGSTHRDVQYNDMVRDNERLRLNDYRNATDGNAVTNSTAKTVSIKEAYSKNK